MTIEVPIVLSGLLFWLIIITNIASNQFGYQTVSNLDAEANLEAIHNDPGKFRTGYVLIVIEHICIILLAVMLFVAFSQYNMMLGVVWLISRTTEGLIQIFNKKNYWKLLTIARQYAEADDADKNKFVDLRLHILESKRSNFAVAQLLFSLGTLAYSILFVTYSLVPAIIGWSGIVASILYGLGNLLTMVKPNFKVLWNIGGLFILLFEIALGTWLLFYPILA